MIQIRNKTYMFLTFAFAILSTYFVYDYLNYMKEREQESVVLGRESLDDIQREIITILDDIVAEGDKIKEILESAMLTKEEVINLVQTRSRDLFYLQGLTVAYEPYVFDESVARFSPYYDKRQGRLIQLEDKYDYTTDSIATNEWYLGPLEENEPHWTDPYFGTGAKLLVADYGLPFYLNNATSPSGVISLTLDLKKLNAKMDSLAVGQTGTAMIFSESGNLVAHPISEYILDLTLQSTAEELGLGEMVDLILLTEEGNLDYTRYTGQHAHAFYAQIPGVNWKTLVVFNSSDLLGNAHLLHRKLVKICLSISALLFMLLLLLIKPRAEAKQKLWSISIYLSIVIVGNIMFMWYLNLNYDYSVGDDNEVFIDSRTSLASFINSENQKVSKLGLQKFIPVATGIFVEEFEFRDSYNVIIRGEVWQKWPKHLARFYDAGLRFPQEALAGRTLITKISEKEDKNYVTHTWSVKVMLKMPFDYSEYPFDVRDVKIEVMYPDVDSGILLVPDVDGYSDIIPFSSPGINKDIYLNDSQLLSTQFSFDLVNYHDRFGHKKFSGTNQFPIMKYSINLKRRLLNVLVMNIIPILVVASMIFLIFYSITKDKDDKSGVSMMGAVQSCAGFFFVLLVAHIDLRRRLSTPSLTYIESYYLTMYVIMALLAINVVAFTKGNNSRFLHYQDNLLVKISYWPVLLFTWMIITLFVFYT
ncbi:Cache domain-containing protein [Reichenbachiella faecimaris]|uniref:Cache domain-containing protein n=1 Tax=Reichenbachiella faecimaris TaxID=692418 RepID=A0A1W2GF17_REIFA|nr:cache domain-containing protein [Reichenbachiella faecimaris]SMD35253.1 Cache domain-containing protein [Reichenbachiella faecimaris]